MAVIRQIFEAFCTPCHRLHEKCKLPGCGAPSPLILGKVCREWRQIAWNTSILWTWIDIPVSRKRYPTQLELLEEWLERAKDQPLSINVRPERGDHSYVYSPSPTALFELLVGHSMKWKALHICSSGDDCTRILNTAQGRVPILESFAISSNGKISDYEEFSLDLLTDAPNLLTLSLFDVRKLGQNTGLWSRLVSLTSDYHLISLFKYTPNLEYCKFADSPYPARHDISSPILLPHLKSLVIKRCRNVDFLSLMDVPSLQRLTVIQPFCNIPFHSIIDFIDKSRFKLHALGISTDSSLDVTSLRELFSRLDSLTRLYIESKKASDYITLMSRIPKMLDPTLDDKAAVLLPNLQVLYYCTVDPISSPAMIDMIKRRWKGQEIIGPDEGVIPGSFAKLRVVRFKKSHQRFKGLHDSLQQEIADGLDVTYDLPYKGEPFD